MMKTKGNHLCNAKRFLILALFFLCGMYFGYEIIVNKSFPFQRDTNSIKSHLNPAAVSNLFIRVTKESSNFPCIHASIRNLRFPICLYKFDSDIYGSGAFLRGQYPDNEQVSLFLHYMGKYSGGNKRNLTLVDIGANIGQFALASAHDGYDTVAAEPSIETYKRLAKSIVMGNITNKVTLLHVAVSNNRDPVTLTMDTANSGDTFVSNHRLKNERKSRYKAQNNSVPGVLLDDLIGFVKNKKAVMKIDTQGSEPRILDPTTSSKFLAEVDVPLILIEWQYHHFQSHKTGYQPLNTSLVPIMLSHLKKLDYEPFDDHGRPINTKDLRSYTGIDILFKRKGVNF